MWVAKKVKTFFRHRKFDSWTISRELFNTIRKIVPEGGAIVELGSGKGTKQLLKHYYVTSVEHDPKFCIKRSDRHRMFFAPLVDNWYDRNVIMRAVSNTYPHLLLIDGPPGHTRIEMQRFFHLFKHLKCPVIFDDVSRHLDEIVMRQWCLEMGYMPMITRVNDSKSFAVCTKI